MSRYGDDTKYKAVRDDYMTPPPLYEPLLELFNKKEFDIDVCSTKKNIPANINYTKDENGLLQTWSGLCFCNPPWNKTPAWVKKGYMSTINTDTEVCFVIPSNRFETGYMQEYILNNPNCVWLIVPNKQGFIIPGEEDKPPIPSVGVAIAIMSWRAGLLKDMLNERNPYGTTAFIGQEKFSKKPQNLSLL